MYMHYVYVLCICICILYSVYVLCNVNKKKGTTSSTTIMGSWWHGGSGKLKSSKDDNTLRDGRKGDPLHKCCGEIVREQYRKWGRQDRSVPKMRFRRASKISNTYFRKEMDRGKERYRIQQQSTDPYRSSVRESCELSSVNSKCPTHSE